MPGVVPDDDYIEILKKWPSSYQECSKQLIIGNNPFLGSGDMHYSAIVRYIHANKEWMSEHNFVRGNNGLIYFRGYINEKIEKLQWFILPNKYDVIKQKEILEFLCQK